MYKGKIIYLLVLSIFLIPISCKREIGSLNNDKPVVRVQDMNVPIDFDWEMRQSLAFDVRMESTKSYMPKAKISICLDDPAVGGRVYTSGSVDPGNSFSGKVNIPAYIEELFLIFEGPFGTVKKEKIAIVSGKINHTFGSAKSQEIPTSFPLKNTAEGPDCDEDCDVYISGGGTVDLNEGKTYCITESFSGKINFQNWNGGASLVICGTANITNNQYLESNAHIIVAEGGTLTTNKTIGLAGGTFTVYQNGYAETGDMVLGNNATFTVYEDANVEVKKFDGWGSNAPLINYGTLLVEQNSAHSSPVENYGVLIYEKNLEISGTSLYNGLSLDCQKELTGYGSGASIVNDGEMNVGQDFEMGNNLLFTNNGTATCQKSLLIYNQASLINNGTITIDDDCDFSSSGAFTNNCQISCNKDIDFSGGQLITFNTGYLKAGEELNFWNSQAVILNDNCMIVCQDMEMDCDMNGTGDLSSVIVSDELDVWNSGDKFGGAIEVATTDGTMNGGGSVNFTDGAYLTSIDEAVNYLPLTACNPEGFGTPTVVDMDFDGIIDDLDAFPNDPLRAFISYLPNDQQYATMAFEDLWPAQGDYDFNDLVVATYASFVTNADGLLVDFNLDFVVLAVGASLDNGFGFQLESVNPGMVASVTGAMLEQGYVNIADNGLEQGQSKAVVIVTESVNDIIHRPGGAFFNTVPGNPQGTSDTVKIMFTFAEPVSMNLVDLDYFNPFIIKNKERSVEIHLPNYPPTDLMDTSLFGTYDDASNPVAGTYYVTNNNLPWGMFLVEPFDYPIEKAQIIDAYNFFSTWAESGGSVYTDWYLNHSGYRNSDAIY